MKIKKLAMFFSLIFILGLTACSTMETPAVNMIDMKTTDFSKTMKKGESCQNYILGFIGPFGDASVVNAAKDAEISKIEVVDYKYTYFILFSQKCVCVYGQ